MFGFANILAVLSYGVDTSRTYFSHISDLHCFFEVDNLV